MKKYTISSNKLQLNFEVSLLLTGGIRTGSRKNAERAGRLTTEISSG